MAKIASGQQMRSAERLLTVLKAIRKDAAARTIAEISRELDLSPSTVRRLLATLEGAGFVRLSPNGASYSLGHELIRLASIALSGSSLVQIAAAAMDGLTQELGETVQLTIRDGADLIVIDSRQSEHLLKAFHTVGHRYPAYRGSAAGQVLLADLDDARLKKTLPGAGKWGAPMGAAPKNLTELKPLLEDCRRSGHAVNDGLTEPNIWAAAAAVRNQHGEAIAALNIPAPRSRAATKKRRETIIKALVGAAENISDATRFMA